MIDLLTIPDVLDDATLRDVHAELHRAAHAPSTVTGLAAEGGVQSRVRRSTRVAVADGVRERVAAGVLRRKAEIEAHFGAELGELEVPQFLRYQEGDYFVAHQDGNTPLIHDATRFRKISVVLFLSTHAEDAAPGAYGGGELVFHGPYSGPTLRVPVAPPPGTLVAFRAETTHEVLPVTHGERYTVASWFRAPGAPPA